MTPALFVSLERLERLCAETKTDDPWYEEDDLVGSLMRDFPGAESIDARFIASAHPSLVEVLIQVAREAQQFLVFDEAKPADGWADRIRALSAALSKLEEQMSAGA